MNRFPRNAFFEETKLKDHFTLTWAKESTCNNKQARGGGGRERERDEKITKDKYALHNRREINEMKDKEENRGMENGREANNKTDEQKQRKSRKQKPREFCWADNKNRTKNENTEIRKIKQNKMRATVIVVEELEKPIKQIIKLI